MKLVLCELGYVILVAGTAADQVPTFKLSDRKPYLPVATLSTQDNVKQLGSGFKRTIKWNKYQPKKNKRKTDF